MLFVYQRFSYESWLVEQVLAPGCASLIALVASTTITYSSLSTAECPIEGELVRGGGFLLACMLLLNLSSVLGSYAACTVPDTVHTASLEAYRDRTKYFAILCAAMYVPTIMATTYTYHSLNAHPSIASWTLGLSFLSNVMLLVTMALLGTTYLLRARMACIVTAYPTLISP